MNSRIIELALKTKFLEKDPQINKRDLSPNRIIDSDKRKRYNKTSENGITNPSNRSKGRNK